MTLRRSLINLCLVTSLILGACDHSNSLYNSLDLTSLPCEHKERFYYPLEFDSQGKFQYESQWEEISQRIKSDSKLTDVYVFIHGWDKTAQIAESDYGDFICRVYAQGLRGKDPVFGVTEASTENAIMLGVFWPSTALANFRDPEILKPFTYFVIRERADILEQTGLQRVLKELSPIHHNPQKSGKTRLHLVGHSFGGRILVKGLTTLLEKDNEAYFRYLQSFEAINVVLLLPAIDSEHTEHLVRRTDRRQLWQIPMHPHPKLDVLYPNLCVSVVYSEHDWANRYLFRLGSVFTSDVVGCAVGACGVEGALIQDVDEEGDLAVYKDVTNRTGEEPNIRYHSWINSLQNSSTGVRNIDAKKIISSHTDIYKGRLAKLLFQILGVPCGIRVSSDG